MCLITMSVLIICDGTVNKLKNDTYQNQVKQIEDEMLLLDKQFIALMPRLDVLARVTMPRGDFTWLLLKKYESYL